MTSIFLIFSTEKRKRGVIVFVAVLLCTVIACGLVACKPGEERIEEKPSQTVSPSSELPPRLDAQTAERFIAETLSTLTVHENNTATFALPANIPIAPDGKTRLSISMYAAYVIEAGSYDVENFLDDEKDWQGGETFTADLSQGEGRLQEVTLQAAFMTEVDEDTAKQYAGDHVQLTAPFSCGQPARGAGPLSSSPEAPTFTQTGRDLVVFYVTPEGRPFDILVTLPEGVDASEPESESDFSPYRPLSLKRDGQEIGSLVPIPYGVTDQETLAAIEQSSSDFPMQIYSPIALSNTVYWEREGLESYYPSEGCISTVCHPTVNGNVVSDCVLAYDLRSEPCFLSLSFTPGALSAEELSTLAQNVAITPKTV